jgi:hypothetical protein
MADFADSIRLAAVVLDLTINGHPTSGNGDTLFENAPVSPCSIQQVAAGTAIYANRPSGGNSPHHHHHGHPLHIPGGRPVSLNTTSSATSVSTTWSTITVADHTEMAKDAASDRVIEDIVFFGGQSFRMYRSA